MSGTDETSIVSSDIQRLSLDQESEEMEIDGDAEIVPLMSSKPSCL